MLDFGLPDISAALFAALLAGLCQAMAPRGADEEAALENEGDRPIVTDDSDLNCAFRAFAAERSCA